jgi:TetR/AcrR family transcriptional repressor of nem operon
MRVSREEAAENRKRVVSTAGALFRQHGFDGIGIADLMKQAGLTHGGFYKQFTSKADLEAEASAEVLSDNAQLWSKIIARNSDAPLARLLNFYLAPAQKHALKEGCAMAALGADAARQTGPVRRVFAEGIAAHARQLEAIIPGNARADKRRNALAALSQMVGALILARAMDDDTLADELLQAAREDLTGRLAG